ncbi:hypothetical protein D9615_009550 [Tricholomella constricta]|uniref:Cytochrome b5 heme-binding domain-containing protein n=1 Tax=Tricholomella constricta TaxID=117010 RepID=A0A8H5GVP8_9AGAR|nr:hypothetical protein D9615_009550 [Tricholomella constricta]
MTTNKAEKKAQVVQIMRRRHLVQNLGPIAFNSSPRLSTNLPGPPSLPSTASHRLHPALGSFSIETAFFETFVGNTTAPNVLTKNLLENLKKRTGIPAEVRIGGITADSTYWNASQEVSLSNFIDKTGALQNTTIGPGFWESVKLLPEGTKVVMNLNLEDLNYQGALDVAESAVKALDPEQLDLLEIGNEPDHYLHFTPQNYSDIWGTWANNISSTLGLKAPRFQVAATVEDPLWPYDAPGASSQLDCLARIEMVSCARAASIRISIVFLDLWQPRIKSVREQLGPDSFVIGKLHTNTNGPVGVFPSYSAYLFVAETLGHSKSLRIANIYPGRQANGSTITTALGDKSEGQLVAYGFWDDKPSGHEFPSKFALLNLQIYNQTQTIPRPIATFDISGYLKNARRAVTVRRLTAPGADIKEANVTTWAGQHFASGLAAGKFMEEKVSGGRIVVKASEAVLVILTDGKMASKQFTLEEIAKHNKQGDLVYDLSRFAGMHPGGLSVLLDEAVAGQDATDAFFSLHRHEVLLRPQYSRLQIGVVVGEEQQIFPRAVGALSKVPYAEPTWLTEGYHNPYYKDHHRRFQAAFRKFVEEVLMPDAQAREEDGKRPSQSVFDEMAKLNLIAMRLGPGEHLKGRVLMGGIVKPEEFDYFHELIMAQEVARMNARGYYDGSGGGTYIGLPPVMNFGKPAIRKKVMEEVFSGKKFICLAISEAFAGSDVAGLKCSAKRVKDGRDVGCRTDQGGMVVLLIERGEGVETKIIKTSYSTAAGTGYVTFEDVFVPYENTLGPDNGGLQVILSNFNHERWGMACGSVSAQRIIVEECLKWATQRQVFGKPLTAQPVIRSKLAAMIARVESAQNWIENVTYQMTHMSYKEQATHLAGQIAFVKKYCTETAQETARDAVQIFGGRGITRTGMGRFIEHYHRTVPFDASRLRQNVTTSRILGGAEDVLGDLGVRQALRKMPKNALYDLSKFAAVHPGGRSVLLDESIAGKDATKTFYSLHRSEILRKPQFARLKIGEIEGDERRHHNTPIPGSLSGVPYAEPTWLTPGYYSPYFKDSHQRFQTAVRKFVEDVVFPDAQAREEDGKMPSKHVFEEMARLNMLAMRLGPGNHLKGRVLMDGLVKPEEELARIHARGYSDGLGGGICIGLPPVLNFGKPALRDKIAAEVLDGKKFICLAITEAFAGSDVAGIKCRAKRVDGGWVKWITNGTFADYFTVGCKTDDGGIVVLVIPRGDGVKTRPITTSYSSAAGTAYVTFDDVRVPYENTLESDKGGLQVILSNFNHERYELRTASM